MLRLFTKRRHFAAIIVLIPFFATISFAAKNHTKYVITNNQVTTNKGNTASFYVPGGTSKVPALKLSKTVRTGGTGGQNFVVPASQLAIGKSGCVYVSNPGSSDVAAIVGSTQKVVGNFKGSKTDTGATAIGLALNSSHLYASFTGSNTIATFKSGSDCKLKFVSDVSTTGLNGGPVNGMDLHGGILVVTYGDGSIESFNISHGAPVSNGDRQLSTGYTSDGGKPDFVQITLDGHYAIFGDHANYIEAEVSDISLGKLTKTVEYGGPGGGLGHGSGFELIKFSPDESLLYIDANSSGNVIGAKFDKSTGVLSAGCDSGTLRGYQTSWLFNDGIAVGGTGAQLYVAEISTQTLSFIGILDASTNGGTCTLIESSKSPARNPRSGWAAYLGTFPLSF
jgi:hypothetical protein